MSGFRFSTHALKIGVWASCVLFAGVLHADQPARILLAQAPPSGPAQTPQERVAMLKQWLAASQQQLRNYQWLETTVVAVNGEQKSSSEKNCYYDVTGTLQKVPLQGDDSSQPSGGPLMRAIKEKKKEDLTSYIQSAVTLIHNYLPPNVDTIQQAVNAGNLGVKVLEPGKQVELQFSNYLQPGDMLGVSIDLQTNRLLGMQVNSYLDDPADKVDMNLQMGVLPDGTIYPETTTLNAPAKNVVVTVTNSGYRPGGG